MNCGDGHQQCETAKYIEIFCKLYSVKYAETTDKAWSVLFLKSHVPQILPHTSDALPFHIKLFTTRQQCGVTRCQTVCRNNSISLYKFVFNDEYYSMCRQAMKCNVVNDGLFDSIRYLLGDITYESRVMMQCLLMPF